MKYNLKISYDKLIENLTDFETQAATILDKEEIGIDEIKTFFDNWDNKVIDFLSESINPEIEILIDQFKYCENDFMSLEFDESILGKQRNLGYKLQQLKLIKGYLSVIDSLSSTETFEINTIQDKISYVLKKLHKLNDDNFYSIRRILELNSIEFRDNETLEIAKNLESRGYVTKKEKYGSDDKVRITVKGALFIERKKKTKKSNKKNEQQLDLLLNEVIEKLEKLGFGQEILYEELEELRSQINNLNKKNWIQLLKGKLMDLALSQVINKEVASFIFESLTNGKLTMIK